MLKGIEKSKLNLKKHNDFLHKQKFERITKIKKFCKRCNKILTYKQKDKGNTFCSRKCVAVYFYKKRGNKPIKNKKIITVYCKCKNCGCRIHNQRKVFCSDHCKHDFKWVAIRERIMNGLVSKRPTLRSFLIRTYGYGCMECGLSEWRGKPIPLDLHHIDGRYRNNSPDNLQILCRNCHGLTDNFAGKNKGNGREYRRINRC